MNTKLTIYILLILLSLFYMWIWSKALSSTQLVEPLYQVTEPVTNDPIHTDGDCNSTVNLEEIPVSNISISKLVNLKEINFLTNASSACNKASLLLLVAVVSAQKNFKNRDIIRKTWSHPLAFGQNSSVVFFTGGDFSNGSDSTELLKEARDNDDLIVANFNDTYRNLTLKVILMLQWIGEFCPNAQYILKCDDDMFVNPYNLMDFVRGNPDTRTFYGKLLHNTQPVRTTDSSYKKWLVTNEEYSGTVYPDYTNGASYLFGSEGISDLLAVSLKIPYFIWEDVFITGECARIVGYCRLHHPIIGIQGISIGKCKILSIISMHGLPIKRIQREWRRINNPHAYKVCKKSKPHTI